ncbi:MAG: hypothetical protein GY833_12135 [Aestuariibacter sp.]|nr:hypothetical protein [Aestuariibacter sp.]|tara:strand:+ start:16520 stop:17041 length:522 start_codon:yes stop_codon:yes gene_type:complete
MTTETEMTVADAQSKMYSEFDADLKTTCPCCYTTKRAYKRALNPSMIQALRLLHEYTSGSVHTAFHLENVLKLADCNSAIRGDATKLRFWGLIKRSDKGIGHYQLTERAIHFLAGELEVPTHIVMYENDVLSESDSKLVWNGESGLAINEHPENLGLFSGLKAAVKNVFNKIQ